MGAPGAAGANDRRTGHPWLREARSCRRPSPRPPCRSSAAAEGVRAWRTQGFLWPVCINVLLLPDVRSVAGPLQPPWQQLAAGHGGRRSQREGARRERSAAGAAGQQLRVNTGLRSRSDFTASPLQAEAINALRGWDARLHPFLDDKPREEGRKKKERTNQNKNTLLQFSGRFLASSLFLADPDTTCRHSAEAALDVLALQAKWFLVKIASRQTAEKDPS